MDYNHRWHFWKIVRKLLIKNYSQRGSEFAEPFAYMTILLYDYQTKYSTIDLEDKQGCINSIKTIVNELNRYNIKDDYLEEVLKWNT